MKLDYDCIRCLLLALEEELQIDDDLESNFIELSSIMKSERLKKFSKSTVAYASMRLEEADLIDANIIFADDRICDIYYLSITYSGHQLLDSIRSPKVWTIIKDRFIKSGVSLTIDAILSVAPKVIQSLLL